MKFQKKSITNLVAITLSIAALSSESFARNSIQVVGSSTVYPFTTVIAEEFGNNTKYRTPIIESTGTGGGMKLFCSGIGPNFPDLTNASRAIKKSELAKCAKKKITPVEIKIGYDGIVIANSVAGKNYTFSKKQVFLALADKIPGKSGKLIKNPNQKWSDIDSSLPNIQIAVYGPPSTSGTRDAFVELVMQDACVNLASFKKAFPNKSIRKKKCHLLRHDGKFIEAGENDNLIVQKLKNDKNAFGIFGFSFLEANRHVVKSVKINNVEPTFENIVNGSYPISRPLFVYFKKENLNLIPGMKEFVKEIISPDTLGNEGYLMQKGLIPLTDSELEKVSNKVSESL